MTKTTKSHTEVLETVRQWEKVAHCPECGHMKCEKCVGALVESDSYVESYEHFMGPVPEEIRDKAIYCCSCRVRHAFIDWVAPETTPAEWPEMDATELAGYFGLGEFDDRFDHRIVGTKRVAERAAALDAISDEINPKPTREE